MTSQPVKPALSTDAALTVRVFRDFGPISQSDWDYLFCGHPDSYELVKLTLSTGMDGFNFYNLVVMQDDRPILSMPLIETEFPLSLSLDGRAREVAGWLEPWALRLVRPRVLLSGVMEAEWGQIGIAPDLDSSRLNAAWDKALAEFKSLSHSLRADIFGFWDITNDGLSLLPAAKLHNFSVVQSQPIFELPVPYRNLDGYFNALSDRDLARYLKRAIAGSQLEIVRTRHAGTWIDRIYDLYLALGAQKDGTFGIHRKAYFENVCAAVPEAEYVLFFSDSRLVGFELLFRNAERIISKYVAMDPVLGREHKLYFISWLEDVKLAIAEKIPVIMFGTSSESLKARLGARAISNSVVFKHNNPVLNWAFHRLRNVLAYDSGLEIAPVSLEYPCRNGKS